MSETAEIGRRERKKRETRAAIRLAALALFAKKGYRETRVSDIAEAADVSEATFFRYFTSKEEVALTDLMSHIDGVLAALARRPLEEPPLAACLAVMETPDALGLVPTNDEISVIPLLAESRSLTGHFFWQIAQVTDRLAADFARRLNSSPADLQVQLLATSVVGALNAVLRAWLTDPAGTQPFEMAKQAFQSLADGLET